MKKPMCVIPAILLLSLAAVPAFSGGKTEQAAKPVTVRFFTGKTETVDLMNGFIERFQAENPGIRVEQEFQKDASNVIKVKLASGDVPDIMTVYTPEYAAQGIFLDLSGEKAWWARINPAVRDLCTDIASGKQYRIATNVTMAGLFYNKKIFRELGLSEAYTMADFSRNMQAVRDRKPGVVPLFMGGRESWMLGHLIEFMAHGVVKQELGLLESRKAFLANDDARLRFGAQGGPMEAFARWFVAARDAKVLNQDLLTATYDNQLEAFAAGKAAMISQGMWALSGILSKNEGMAADIGFSPYPPLIEGMKPVILSAEDSAYTVSAASAHPAQTKAFLDFLFRKDAMKAYSEFVKSPSAFTDVEANWGPLAGEVAKALKTGVNIGFTNEAPAGFPGDDAGRMVQELYAGKYSSPLEFAAAYKSRWDSAWSSAK